MSADRTSVQLPRDLKRQVDVIAERDGESFAGIVRAALRAYVKADKAADQDPGERDEE